MLRLRAVARYKPCLSAPSPLRVRSHLLPCKSSGSLPFTQHYQRLRLVSSLLHTSCVRSNPRPSEPTLDLEQDSTRRTPNAIRNAVLFAGFVAFDVYLWAATRTNSDTGGWVKRIARQRGSAEGIENSAITRARKFEFKEKLERWTLRVVRTVGGLPQILRVAIGEGTINIANRILQAPDALKVCWGICAINGAVYLAWKVPRLSRFMLRNFQHHPLSGRSRTLLTSVFSHSSFMHLFFNCFALNGFGYAAGYYLTTQQNTGPSELLESTSALHFLAFFVSAGLFASLASHIVSVKAYDSVVRALAKSAPRPRLRASLGASGAIYSCVTLTALAYPDLHINILFVPVDIPIQYGVGGLMLLDMIGFIRGWRLFDHIAHLGGALFGAWYYMYGPRLWDAWRAASANVFGGKPKAQQRIH
ncbi:hypothetical protein GGX14DRAFT_424973 [Mycena pura]|uniref:Peptidase S54 rhomboid domain-containing protein n=1 Tax=Mycena pura TaxID=153505 RepID=A0AAD7E220_9AGAR|nr:hypothetical protein GGX14DRAFT_424973 [Mycena pura]